MNSNRRFNSLLVTLLAAFLACASATGCLSDPASVSPVGSEDVGGNADAGDDDVQTNSAIDVTLEPDNRDADELCESKTEGELCDELDIECGDFLEDNGCGEEIAISCGPCSNDEVCVGNICCELFDDEEACEKAEKFCGEHTVGDGCSGDTEVNCGHPIDSGCELGCNPDSGECCNASLGDVLGCVLI